MSRFCIIDRCEVAQSHDIVAPAFSPLGSRLVCLLFLFRLYCAWPIPELVYSEAGFLTLLLDTPQLEVLSTLCGGLPAIMYINSLYGFINSSV